MRKLTHRIEFAVFVFVVLHDNTFELIVADAVALYVHPTQSEE